MQIGERAVSVWFRAGSLAANFLVVNLLWMVCSLPLITLLPSTAALFGTMRQWSDTGEEAIFGTYFREWRANCLRSYVVGLPSVAIAIILTLEFLFYYHQHGTMSLLMLALVCSCILLFLLTSVYLWPLLVSCDSSARSLWSTAFVYGLRFCKLSFATVLPVWFLASVLILWSPALLFTAVIPICVWLTHRVAREVIP